MEKFELINNYINGKLSPEEKAQLEQSLSGDETLKNMLDHEKLVKEAVSRYRSAQFKARMDNVSVGSNVSNSLKVFTALMILGSGAAGTYFYLNNNNTDALHNKESRITLNKPTIQTPSFKESAASTSKKEPAETPANTKKSAKASQKVLQGDINPSVHQDEIDIASPSDFNTKDNTANEGDITRSVKSPKTDVSVEVNDSEELKYQNYNSKLYLMGKFTKKYEIIELKPYELYLSYDGSFYYLRNNVQKSTRLEKVAETKLLKTLNEKLKNHSN